MLLLWLAYHFLSFRDLLWPCLEMLILSPDSVSPLLRLLSWRPSSMNAVSFLCSCCTVPTHYSTECTCFPQEFPLLPLGFKSLEGRGRFSSCSQCLVTALTVNKCCWINQWIIHQQWSRWSLMISKNGGREQWGKNHRFSSEIPTQPLRGWWSNVELFSKKSWSRARVLKVWSQTIISISWELLRNVNFQSHPDLRNPNSRAGQQSCFNKSSRWFWCPKVLELLVWRVELQ